MFLDLELPDLSGFEVVATLRALAATQQIPIIIHTSKVLEESELEHLTRETVAVLSKETPSREAAVARVREALARAGMGASPGGGDRG